MDSLKSVIRHILPSAHFGRKSSGRSKKGENEGGKGGAGKGKGRGPPVRSVSTSHMARDKGGKPRLLPSTSAKELTAPLGPERQHPPTPDWECTRTPPPSKPPRKDRVFCVELRTEGGGGDLGLEVEVVPLGAGGGGGRPEGTGDPGSGGQGSGGQGSGTGPSPTLPQGSGLPPSTPLCAVRVVGVKEGGAAEREGRVRVKDEVVEVNGKTLLRESQDSVRQILLSAAQTGRVVLTLRRRRKHSALPPPIPVRHTSSLQDSPILLRRSGSTPGNSFTPTPLSRSSSCLPHYSRSSPLLADPRPRPHTTGGHLSPDPPGLSPLSPAVRFYAGEVSDSEEELFCSRTPSPRLHPMSASCHPAWPHPQPPAVGGQGGGGRGVSRGVEVGKEGGQGVVEVRAGPNVSLYRTRSSSAVDHAWGAWPCWTAALEASGFPPPAPLQGLPPPAPLQGLPPPAPLQASGSRTMTADTSADRAAHSRQGGGELSAGDVCQCDNTASSRSRPSAPEQGPRTADLPINGSDNNDDNLQQRPRPRQESRSPPTPRAGRRERGSHSLRGEDWRGEGRGDGRHLSGPHTSPGSRSLGTPSFATPSFATPSLGAERVGGVGAHNGSSLSASLSPVKKRVISQLELRKDSQGLGLHIAGGRGSKRGDIGIFVAGLTEGGAAFRDGRLKRGDELLMINGRSLVGLSHQQAVDLLRGAPDTVTMLVASKLRQSASIAGTTLPSLSRMTTPADGFFQNHRPLHKSRSKEETGSGPPRGLQSEGARHVSPAHTISVQKGWKGKGLGFTIIGGVDRQSRDEAGVHVRRIIPSGAVAEDGRLQEGDEILAVNGRSVTDLTHHQLVALFRTLPSGLVTLTFRPHPPSSSCHRGECTSGSSTDGSPVSTPSHSPRHTPHNSVSDSPVSADSSASDTKSTTRNSGTPPPPIPIQRMSPHRGAPPIWSLPSQPSGEGRTVQAVTGVTRNDQPVSGVSRNDHPLSGVSRNDQPLSGVSRNDQPLSGAARNDPPVSSIPRNDQPVSEMTRNDGHESGVARNDGRTSRVSRKDGRVPGVENVGNAMVQEARAHRRPQSMRGQVDCRGQPRDVSDTRPPAPVMGLSGLSAHRDSSPGRHLHQHQHPTCLPPPSLADPSAEGRQSVLAWTCVPDYCSPWGEGGGTCVDRTGHQVTEDRQQIDVKSPRLHRPPPPSWPPHLPLPPHSAPSSPQKVAVRCQHQTEAERVAADNAPHGSQFCRQQPPVTHTAPDTSPRAVSSAPVYRNMEPSPGSAFSSPASAVSPVTSPTPPHKTPANPAVGLYSDPSLTSRTLPSQAPAGQWPTPSGSGQAPVFQPWSGATSSYCKAYSASSACYANVSSSYFHYHSNELSMWRGTTDPTSPPHTSPPHTSPPSHTSPPHHTVPPPHHHHHHHHPLHRTCTSPVEGRRGVGVGPQEGGVWRGGGQQQVSTSLDILLHKGGGDSVGINVIRQVTGAVSSVHVQDITPGSLAHRDGRLQRGDVLYSVNGRWLADLSLLDLFQLFRSLPPGPVRIRAARLQESSSVEAL